MNTPKTKLDVIMKTLPKGVRPTISQLSEPEWLDVNLVLDEKLVRELIPDLKEAGAEDIVEYPLNKLIH